MIKELSNGIKKVWDKTIFKSMIDKKKEDIKFKQEIMAEAREEAKTEIKEQLKEKYKKQIIDKAVGNKTESKSSLNKFANAFKLDIGGTDKINKMLGTKQQNNQRQNNNMFSSEKIASMMGIKKNTNNTKPK